MKSTYLSFPLLLTGLMLPFLLCCKKEVIKVIPTVTIAAITELTATTATSGGVVTYDGGASVTSRGVCWSANEDPTTADSKTSNASGTGNFSSSLTGLTPGGTYHIRAYALNSVGTAYSSQVKLTTLALMSVLTTSELSAITSTTASSGGTITNDGGSSVTERGVCWSTSQNPTIADSKSTNGTGSGIFTSAITGLVPGATFYVRAYATNSIGTAYGNQVTAVSTAVLPVMTTTAVSALTSTTAISGGNITNNGGATVTARGVCWGTAQNPTTSNSKTTDGNGSGIFTSAITALTPGMTYYIRAYATNSIGTVYGNEVTAIAVAVLPVITTTSISALTSTTATSGGNSTSDGGAAITTRGICWSTSPNPTVADSKNPNGTGSGSFTGSITGLSPGVTYYVRAYATNSIGTAYGNEVMTTTTAVLSILSTTAISAITSSTATSGGNITGNGGAAVTARGVCWSTSQNPTTADNKTSDGTGSGSFTGSITGLSPGVTYYVRAYATNSIGTSYGNEVITTTTSVLSTLTTTSVSAVTSTSVTSGGNITSNGGSAVTARGICWSNTTNPSITNSKTNDGTGSGSFTSSVTGLAPGAIYYIRAYATNSIGTTYGNEITTTTTAILPVISTSTVSGITSNAATSGGNITSDGGAAVTVRGVCWSTSQNPTIASSKTTNGTATGSFTSSITGLTPGTTYYVRAYATNSIGTAYGNEVTTTTTAILPAISTSSVTGLTSIAAISGGNITSDGGSTVTARGVCWSTSQNPTNAGSKTTNGMGTGSFTSSITGLTPGTIYYIRAYATNGIGTIYGNEVTTTTSVDVAVLNTTAASDITSTTVTSGGNITGNGGAAVTSSGVCWSTSQNPTITDSKTTDGTVSGVFTSSLAGLIPGSTYYVRAYAINSTGTAYGNQVSFTTTALAIGQSYNGGIIAYILQSGDPGYVVGETHGLITAPSNQSNGAWGCYGTSIAGADGTALGTGNQNTIDIMAGCSTAGIATRICGDLVLNGYSDWYLPSKDELQKLFINAGAIGGFVPDNYWCSSEYNFINGWKLNFGNGSWSSNSAKTGVRYVRAVRSF